MPPKAVQNPKKSKPQLPIDIDALEEVLAPVKEPTGILTLAEDEYTRKKQADFLNIPFEQLDLYEASQLFQMLDYKIRQYLQDARDAKVKDPLKDVERRMQQFPGRTKTNSAEIRKRIQSWKGKEHLVDEDFLPSKETQIAPDGEEVHVYMEGGDEEIPETNKHRRDGVTVGVIEETETPPGMIPDDLVGDRPPKNLADLYARWPMASNSNYHIRLERTKPKTFHGVSCAGLVAEIRGRRITEAEIQQTYGGTEYKLTLYGPDPRSLQDETGELKVKALTEPFNLFVPVRPPNLSALPGMEQQMQTPNPMQPFGPQVQQPASPADAAKHKTDVDYQKWNQERMDAKEREARTEEQKQQKAIDNHVALLMGSVMTQNNETLRHEREEARRREELHRKEVEAERLARQQKEAAILEAKEENQASVVKLIDRMGPERENEIRRLVDSHKEQMENLRRAFEEQIKAMRDRHDGDLRRSDERLRDTESQYRLLLEQERSSNQKTLENERQSWSQRERDLRDQYERDKTAMREQFQSRFEDMRMQKDAEIKNIERAQTQMLNVIKESFETKTAVTETTHKMMLTHISERLEDAREETNRVREELEESKDIGVVLERAKAQAEVLGYKKADDDAPKDWKERLVMTLGSGLTSAFSNAKDWLPQVMEQRQQQMLQLQAAQQQQQQEQAVRVQEARRQQAVQAQVPNEPGRPRRSRGAQWASEGQPPPRPPTGQPLGFEPIPDNSQSAQATEKAAQPAPQPVVNTSASEVVEIPASNGNGAVPTDLFPEKFVTHFGLEGVVGFVQMTQEHIQIQTDPAMFAQGFVEAFPNQARTLVTKFEPNEVIEAVKNIPESESSSILTVKGQKWLRQMWQSLSKQLSSAANSAPQTTA